MRPSALPMLAQCAQWISGGGNEETDAGLVRHQLFDLLIRIPGDITRFGTSAQLTEAEKEGVMWAASYFSVKAPQSDYPVLTNHRVNPITADFDPIFPEGGTLDAACGPVLFDLKWRERDYTAQMAAYALGMIQQDGWKEVTAHLLFAEPRRVQVLTFTEGTAMEIIMPIVDRVKAGVDPEPCDACAWCGRRMNCPALLTRVQTIGANREDWALAEWHSSKIETTEDMGKALRLARHVAEWCKSVEHHAREMALKQGQIPDGYTLKTRRGNREIVSLLDAYTRSGLSQDAFLAACSCSVTALEREYARIQQLPAKAAAKDLELRLGDAMQRKETTQMLVEQKQQPKQIEEKDSYA